MGRSATFPVLSANISGSEALTDHVPAIIGETSRGTRVGIIGVTTNEQLQVRPTLDPDVRVGDPVEQARSWQRVLTPLVDLLIILSHLGLNVPGSRHTSEVDDRSLAEALSVSRLEQTTYTPERTRRTETAGTDGPPVLIIGGHTHTVIDPQVDPVVVNGIPIFQAGCNLSHLGVIDIQEGVTGRLIPLSPEQATLPADWGKLPLEIAAIHSRTISSLSRAAARVVADIGSASDASETTTLEDRLTGECAIANMITDAIRRGIRSGEDHPVIVATDASGIHSGLMDDTSLRVDDLYRILPYADSLYRAEITPTQLHVVLGSNALRILPREKLMTRGGPIGLRDWAYIARGFLHFSENLRYTMSTGTGETTVEDVTLDGVRLDQMPRRQRIVVYCNSFSAMGNQGWGIADDASFREFGRVSLRAFGFRDTGRPYRQALIDSLEGAGALRIAKDGRINHRRALVTDALAGA
jgi:hypothetical protein